MSTPIGVDLRCSAIVLREREVLLIHRSRGGVDDWVLPGGSPRPGESTAACARREVREETGLHVHPARVAFVAEVTGPHPGPRTVDIIFAASESPPRRQPEIREEGLEPHFVPVSTVHELDLRPPVAGYLRGLVRSGGQRYAPYLANLWRPARGNGEPGGSAADQP
jgi:8-oxo-dGTP diphosphatase